MVFDTATQITISTYSSIYSGGGDRGTEPTIVWFAVTQPTLSETIYHRLWSDGLLQQRWVYSVWNDCTAYDAHSCGGWYDVEPPAGGDGVACGADVNNDSVVDVNDIMVVLEGWYDDVVCEPTYDCLDLNNLPSGMGG